MGGIKWQMCWRCGTNIGHRPGRCWFRNVTSMDWRNGSFSSSVRSQRRVSTIGFGNFTVRWSRPLRRSWNRLPSRMVCFRFSIAERNCSCPAMCIWIPLRHCCGRYNRYDRSEQNMQLQRSLRIYRSTSGHRWFCCRCDAAVWRSSGWNFCF